MTEAGRQHVIASEGIRLQAYVDEAGLLTIGIGHLITADELKTGMIQIGSDLVEYSKGLTNEQAFTLLDQDTHTHENELQRLITVPLKANQLDALTSFAFNMKYVFLSLVVLLWLQPQLPSAPKDLQYGCTPSGNGVSLNWGAVTGATSYLLFVDDVTNNADISKPPAVTSNWFKQSKGEQNGIFVKNNSNYTQSIKPQTTYYWWVQAVNARGRSMVSIQAQFKCVPSSDTPQ